MARATSSLPVPDSPVTKIGAWLRATRAICPRRLTITWDWPVRPLSSPAGSGAASPSCRAACTMALRRASSTGFETKSKAPFFRASTARSVLPWAVIIATGMPGQWRWICSTSSRPSPSGRRMSVRQRSKPWRASRARALATLSASRTRRPSWSRVMWSNSRMSASSSTINTWGLFMVTAFQDPAGVDETDAKEAGLGGGGGLVFQGGVVDFAKFAGDVEAKARALAGGGEERFEPFAAILFRHPGAAVENVEHRQAVDAAEPRPQPRPGLAAGLQAVAHGVVEKVAEHLLQVGGIERGGNLLGLEAQFDTGVAGAGLAVVGDELGQPAHQVDALEAVVVAPGELQHVLDDLVNPPRLLGDDLGEARRGGVAVAELGEQLGGVADGPQRIADLVGDAAGQSPQGCHLELLGLLGGGAEILEKDHGARVPGLVEGLEAGLHLGVALLGDEGFGSRQGRLLPALQLAEQPRLLAQVVAPAKGRAAVAAEQLHRRLVDQLDGATAVHHQDA